MYEIWLATNILWEMALGVWPLLAAAAVLWAGLMGFALRRPRERWRRGFPLAVLAGAAVTTASVLLVPGAIHSSLAEMGYWVDWANLFAISLGFGAVAAAFAWPLSALRRGAA